jgi:hypothetical protein
VEARRATPARSRIRLLTTARQAASWPCQRRKPQSFGPGVRVFHQPSSRAFNVSREWWHLSATRSADASGLGAASRRSTSRSDRLSTECHSARARCQCPRRGRPAACGKTVPARVPPPTTTPTSPTADPAAEPVPSHNRKRLPQISDSGQGDLVNGRSGVVAGFRAHPVAGGQGGVLAGRQRACPCHAWFTAAARLR